MNQTNERSRYRSWLYLFLISFMIGTIVMNAGRSFLLGETGIFNDTSMNRLKYLEINSNNFFQYVMKERIIAIGLLCLLSTTGMGLAATYLYVFEQGALVGMVLTAAAIRYGASGILLMITSWFPQQLLLVPAWFLVLGWCSNNCARRYYPQKAVGIRYPTKRQNYLAQTVHLLWAIGVVIIGTILECYVNPILVSDLLKIF